MPTDQRVPHHHPIQPCRKLLDGLANVLEISDGDRAGKLTIRPRPGIRPAERLAVPLVERREVRDRLLTTPTLTLPP